MDLVDGVQMRMGSMAQSVVQLASAEVVLVVTMKEAAAAAAADIADMLVYC